MIEQLELTKQYKQNMLSQMENLQTPTEGEEDEIDGDNFYD